jgi:hypothetical protein
MTLYTPSVSIPTHHTHTLLSVAQNKDELAIPLELAAIPTPKAFKEAVESLSPTQREFAKAIRSMQVVGDRVPYPVHAGM